MYQILYVGQKATFNIQSVTTKLNQSLQNSFQFLRLNNLDEVIEHFFSGDPVVMLILEEGVGDFSQFVIELRVDESFQYLPVLLVLEEFSRENKAKYFELELSGFLPMDMTEEELFFTSGSMVKPQMRVDHLGKELGDVSQLNITKAIQLEVIRKFIPQTVWKNSEKLAEIQNFEIPEETQDLAILFADIQSFTSIAENLTPDKVIELLNSLFEITSQIIYDNHGDIDKIIGDAFLAVFHSSENALISAIQIQDKIKEFNEQQLKQNRAKTQFRIGLNYGNVIRGSVGGSLRFDNTLIGDPVNTAQRLESLSSPGSILASRCFMDQIDCLSDKKLIFHQFVLKGKDIQVDACHIYDYYLMDPKILECLKSR